MTKDAEYKFGRAHVKAGKEYEVVSQYDGRKDAEVELMNGDSDIRDVPPVYEIIDNKGESLFMDKGGNGKYFMLVEK